MTYLLQSFSLHGCVLAESECEIAVVAARAHTVAAVQGRSALMLFREKTDYLRAVGTLGPVGLLADTYDPRV
jgi:hypothetical protein